MQNKKFKLTVVSPVFNEEAVIASFYISVKGVLENLMRDQEIETQILFVVDRSTDNTLNILREIAQQDPKTKIIVLSSRFGHQHSLLAGIENAQDADVIVMLDSDLQHPPELIPRLLAEYKKGAEVVYTVRAETHVGFWRKLAGKLFYAAMSILSKSPIKANAADFRLIGPRIANTLRNDFKERNMFLRGLFSWMGFTQVAVPFNAEKRFAGQSKYSLSRTFRLALAGILSSSTRPLYMGIFVGMGFAVLGFILALIALVNYFFGHGIPSGWTTIVILLLLFGGVQLIVVGILGAYIGGIYEEVKGRPRYIIAEEISHETSEL